MGLLGNFREVVRNLKHSRSQAKFCPRCGSPHLRLSSRFDVWLFPEQYLCGNCGYSGPVVMEMDKGELEKIMGASATLEAVDSTGASDSCSDSEL